MTAQPDHPSPAAGTDGGTSPVGGSSPASSQASTAYLAGYSDGYRAAISVLDEAGAFLATLKPSQALDLAAARGRRDTSPTPAKTPAQIRADAYTSWDLPNPGAGQGTSPSSDQADVDSGARSTDVDGMDL